jgi:hypothetical protein
MTFREAFAKARAEGVKEFTWAGKRYTTELAKEAATEAAPDASPRPKAKPQEKPATADWFKQGVENALTTPERLSGGRLAERKALRAKGEDTSAAASDDPAPKSEAAAEALYASRKEEIRNYLMDSDRAAAEAGNTAGARGSFEGAKAAVSAKAASERAKETSERIKGKNNARTNYGVSDEMSFREAFAEARRKGAGAADIFVWRGKRYTAALA